MVKTEKVLILLVGCLFMFMSFTSMALAEGEKVYDDAGLFSEQEKAELQEKAVLLSEQEALDIIIVTTNDNQGKTSRQYAEDFYQQNGFGYAGTADGILYLVNMNDREVYIYTKDKAFEYIPDYRVEEILDKVTPYLSQNNYLESVNVFMTEVERIMQEGLTVDDSAAGGSPGYSDYPDAEYTDTSAEMSLTQELFIYLGVAMATGGITIAIMAMYNRGRSTVNAGTYLENDSFIITRRVDHHYNTSVTQQVIQRNTNNSSGGSFGGGSGGGGSSSGGGGRSF
jgi:uncharacterized protein